MKSIAADVNKLVCDGAEHHPEDTRLALKALKSCTTFDALDAAAQELPVTCRARAQRILRRAKKDGTTPMALLNHLDAAQATHMPKTLTAQEALDQYVQGNCSLEEAGFYYQT